VWWTERYLWRSMAHTRHRLGQKERKNGRPFAQRVRWSGSTVIDHGSRALTSNIVHCLPGIVKHRGLYCLRTTENISHIPLERSSVRSRN
jgi:hypothetical protein